MKRIYIYLLSAIVSLAFAPAVSAQADYSIHGVIGDLEFKNTSDVYTVKNNVGVRKQVSVPVEGKYWIKLEAFATGEASVIVNSKPADILLVLDLSTSMVSGYPTTQSTTSRLDALKTAAKAFVKSIYDNADAASEADPNYANRIGIVTFHGARTDGQGATDITNAWLDVKNNYNTLTSNIDNLYTSNSQSIPKGTHTHTGLYYAIENYLDNDGYDVSGAARTGDKARDDASLTVVVFTDGEPAGGSATIGGQNQNTFNNYIANTAVHYANQLKTEYEATVYTVFVGSSNDEIEHFLNALSSNYPHADATCDETAWDDAVTYGEGTYNGGYYQDASSADLTSIFEAIAGQSGGSANTELTSATTTVDIVSDSFLLPNGTVAGDIKVFTANCNYANAETKTYRFDTEVLAPHSEDKYRIYTSTTQYTEHDVDDAIVVTPDVDNNTIKVTGFDYSHNWCGTLTSGSTVTYQGHKIIIMIPIQANPDAVGGPNVVTNVKGSGIYVNSGDSTPLIEFDYPTISLPVNIYIEKAGLKNGESAKFIIEKAVMPASGNPDEVQANAWSYVTSVFVTKPQNAAATDPDPVVKIKGLPATEIEGTGSSAVQKALLYRIREENWSWSYTLLTGPQYTVSEKVDNPFLFTNTPKTNIGIRVRHAESKSTNIFKTGETGGHYDDSKTNVRP